MVADECCVNLGETKTCQVNFSPSFANTSSPRGKRGEEGECRQVQPNVMGFLDEEGVRQEVHLPKGTYDTAVLYFKDANWTALKSFPKWGKLCSEAL